MFHLKSCLFIFKEQKEFGEIDDVIANLEDEIIKVDEAIEKSATDFVKLEELLKEKEVLQNTLEEKYERWTYLNELAEKIEAQKK